MLIFSSNAGYSWCFQTQNESKECANVSSHKQRHFDPIFLVLHVEPPIFRVDVDQGNILSNKSQCEEDQQYDSMSTSWYRRKLVVAFFNNQTNSEEIRKNYERCVKDLELMNRSQVSEIS